MERKLQQEAEGKPLPKCPLSHKCLRLFGYQIDEFSNVFLPNVSCRMLSSTRRFVLWLLLALTTMAVGSHCLL